ncbi:MAG TPA: hypothetical protein PKY28_03580 [Ferruginibacter sp.]|nr:hypothetical protein [Chitinophagaceae bacterium]HQW92149.1 hypothetical protein [Ferruginibacter sp.]
MKKQILTLLLVAVAGISSYAQCEKKSVLSSSVTEYLDASGEIRRTVVEVTTIEFDSKTIFISPGDHNMDGTVNSITCDWKTPYKEGKTVMKATINVGEGQTMDVTITLEGKDGKVVFLFEETPEKRIRLTLDKFEEKK